MLSLAELQGIFDRQRTATDARPLFTALDIDGSGRLGASELVALAKHPGILASAEVDPAAHGRLPPAWRDADLNQDGSISEPELERQLRQLDPLLRRWAKKIVADADSSGNGALSASELQAASLTPLPVPAHLQQLKPEQIKKLMQEKK